jgi:hypothetical protein
MIAALPALSVSVSRSSVLPDAAAVEQDRRSPHAADAVPS